METTINSMDKLNLYRRFSWQCWPAFLTINSWLAPLDTASQFELVSALAAEYVPCELVGKVWQEMVL